MSALVGTLCTSVAQINYVPGSYGGALQVPIVARVMAQQTRPVAVANACPRRAAAGSIAAAGDRGSLTSEQPAAANLGARQPPRNFHNHVMSHFTPSLAWCSLLNHAPALRPSRGPVPTSSLFALRRRIGTRGHWSAAEHARTLAQMPDCGRLLRRSRPGRSRRNALPRSNPGHGPPA